MQKLQIEALTRKTNGQVLLRFENGVETTLYWSELRKLARLENRDMLRQGDWIQYASYETLLTEIVGLRAKKRAMHLLEQMDRTERELSDKLRRSGYPEACVELAVEYVRSYHYIDDYRYAVRYIRYHQEKKSRQRLQTDLMRKGVDRRVAERAFDEAFSADERDKIVSLLRQRRYDPDCADPSAQRKMYRFLLGRGYRSSDILAVMRQEMQETM